MPPGRKGPPGSVCVWIFSLSDCLSICLYVILCHLIKVQYLKFRGQYSNQMKLLVHLSFSHTSLTSLAPFGVSKCRTLRFEKYLLFCQWRHLCFTNKINIVAFRFLIEEMMAKHAEFDGFSNSMMASGNPGGIHLRSTTTPLEPASRCSCWPRLNLIRISLYYIVAIKIGMSLISQTNIAPFRFLIEEMMAKHAEFDGFSNSMMASGNPGGIHLRSTTTPLEPASRCSCWPRLNLEYRYIILLPLRSACY